MNEEKLTKAIKVLKHALNDYLTNESMIHIFIVNTIFPDGEEIEHPDGRKITSKDIVVDDVEITLIH